MKRFMITLFVLLLVVLPAAADDVTDTMDRAKQAYQQKQYSQALSDLAYAQSQIHTLLGDLYASALPAPLAGWTAEEASNASAGMGFLGGGIAVTRRYEQPVEEVPVDEEGFEEYVETPTVEISVMADSPALSGVMMMIGNPMFLGGNRLVQVQGLKAVEEWSAEDGHGQLQIVLDNRILITVSGNGLKDKATLMSYANAVNIAKLRSALTS